MRKPAFATDRVSACAIGLLYIAGGGLVLLSEALDSLRGKGATATMLLAMLAVLAGLAILTVRRRRLRAATYHLLVGCATAMITAAVLLANGGAASTAFASLYIFVAIDCFFFFDWPAALLHLLVFETAAGLALNAVGSPASHIVVQQGSAAVVALVIGWLTRAASVVEVDPLTRLLNRRGLDRVLGEALDRSERDGSSLCLVLIDLDRFRLINARGGPVSGDRLLSELARDWASRMRPGQSLARYGGDVFAVVLPSCPPERAARLADELRQRRVGALSCSAGVASFEPGDSASMLLCRADVALFEAKTAGGDQTAVYAGASDLGAEELVQAIGAGELEMHYQPIVDLTDGVEIGAEALVRWNHPGKGMVPPAEFVPLAERSGAIHALGRWTLEQACRHGAARLTNDGRKWALSVNVSGRELRRQDFPQLLRDTLARTGMQPQALTVEVTETAFDHDEDQLIANLVEVRALGVKVAIDDFGTGYSTLSRLHRFPVDGLKIDRSFVTAIPSSTDDVPILQAIVALAHALNLKIVAEGVETPRQAAVLRGLGCEYAQGFLYGRAAPAEQPVLGRLAATGPSRT